MSTPGSASVPATRIQWFLMCNASDSKSCAAIDTWAGANLECGGTIPSQRDHDAAFAGLQITVWVVTIPKVPRHSCITMILPGAYNLQAIQTRRESGVALQRLPPHSKFAHRYRKYPPQFASSH